MARTALTPINVSGPYGSATTLTWTAADDVNKNSFAWTGKEILLVKNEDTSEQTVTVQGVACAHGRTGTVSKAVSAGAFAVFPFFSNPEGWLQSDGKIYVDAASANVKFCILRLP